MNLYKITLMKIILNKWNCKGIQTEIKLIGKSCFQKEQVNLQN